DPVVLVGEGLHGVCQPIVVLLSEGLPKAPDWRAEEGGLGAIQIVRSVGVQYFAVVPYLVELVVDHVASQPSQAVVDQTEYVKIAVPAVQFVEPPTRHDVRHGLQFVAYLTKRE